MNNLVFAISLLFYIMFFLGIFMVFLRPFMNILARISLRFRLLGRGMGSKENALFTILSRLVFIALGKERKGKSLFIILVLIFAFCFSFSYLYFKLAISFLIAILCTSIPILSLVSKIETQRNRSGKECIIFINEFYREYKIENKNIFTAMEKTSSASSNYPTCGKYLYQLLLRLRSSGIKDEQKRYCDDFAYSLGSAWGKSLSSCILCACDGLDISDALLDILAQLKLSKESYEERKRLNSESMRMTLFLIPGLYVVSFFAGHKWLDLSYGTLLKNQFTSAAGILFFFVIIILFFFNYIVLNVVSTEKIDI